MTLLYSGRSDCVYGCVTGYGTVCFDRLLENCHWPLLFMNCVRNETREVSVVKFPFVTVLLAIAVFRGEEIENCAIVGYYAASSNSYRCCGTAVRKYQSLGSNPEERKYQYIILHMRYSFPGAFTVYVSLTALQCTCH